MKIENFNLKVGDPLVRKNRFGEILGFYKETVKDKKGIWIRFKRKNTSASYIGNINQIRPANENDLKELS